MLSPRRTRPAPCEIVIGDPILLLVLFFVEELKQRNCLTHGSRGRHKSRIISKIDQFLKNRRSNDYKKKKKILFVLWEAVFLIMLFPSLRDMYCNV